MGWEKNPFLSPLRSKPCFRWKEISQKYILYLREFNVPASKGQDLYVFLSNFTVLVVMSILVDLLRTLSDGTKPNKIHCHVVNACSIQTYCMKSSLCSNAVAKHTTYDFV